MYLHEDKWEVAMNLKLNLKLAWWSGGGLGSYYSGVCFTFLQCLKYSYFRHCRVAMNLCSYSYMDNVHSSIS